MLRAELELLAERVIDLSFEVHRELGPGLLESVYERILENELGRQGLKDERQRNVAFEFRGIRYQKGLTVDLLVDDRLVVEVKSIERLVPVNYKQLLTYLRLLHLPLGLLLNFGGARLADGLRRVVNNYRGCRLVRMTPTDHVATSRRRAKYP